jgi:hypothetical protein
VAQVKVLHGLLNESRRTTVEHALCFARHSEGNEIEFSNAFGPQTSLPCDLLIITYDLLAFRNTPYWPFLRKLIWSQVERSSKVAYFPQDDYSSCNVLDDLFRSTPNCVVYSPIVNDLEILYPKSTKKGIEFKEALTGYVDDHLSLLATKYSRAFSRRQIDVGQRVRHLPPQFGQEAQTKGRIAIEFAKLAMQEEFLCDVSTDSTKVLLGESWHDFLGNTKFTVGGLGGASLADPKGLLADRVRRRMFRNPKLQMEEINATFSSRGGREGDFGAISPRIFEAAALGVCQILVEANYVDTLVPWTHYIPLDKELKNIDEVFEFMRNTEACEQLANQCRKVLIESGDFSYEKFVRNFWSEELELQKQYPLSPVFRDSIGDLLPIFLEGGENQGRAADCVRRAFVNNKKILPSDYSVKEKKSFPSVEEMRAMQSWLEGIQKNEIILESLLMSWTSVRGSGWLDQYSECWQ